MGAFQSSCSHNAVQRTSMEEDIKDNKPNVYVRPPPPPPTMQRMETFDERLYRKFTQQPLVPVGCAVTAYFLVSGMRSFYNRDSARSQKMMRARVGAQFVTLMLFVSYVGLGNFDFTLAPMYQRSMERKQKEKETREPKDEGQRQ